MTMDRSFFEKPIAHRGFHDVTEGRVENSRAAFEAALEMGFGIELDVQMSRDGVPVVFHDDTLDRLTPLSGPVRDKTVEELAGIPLSGGPDTIETLKDILELIGEKAPVLVEIKDQGARAGHDSASLDQVAGWVVKTAVASHNVTAAIMSFNPAYMAALSWLEPSIPRGLVGMVFDEPNLSPEVNAALTDYVAFETSGCAFVSHDRNSLETPAVARLKSKGVPIFTWTVRSPDEESEARKVADNITFESYVPG